MLRTLRVLEDRHHNVMYAPRMLQPQSSPPVLDTFHMGLPATANRTLADATHTLAGRQALLWLSGCS